MPLPIVLLLFLVLAGALAAGFLGSPGGRMRPLMTMLLLGLGLVLLPLGMGAVVIGRPEAGTLMVWAGVLLFSCAARLLRAPEPRQDDEDEDDGGGGGGPHDPPPDPGGPSLDWEAFDRQREGWGTERGPVGAR
jgi:hypothetical protein